MLRRVSSRLSSKGTLAQSLLLNARQQEQNLQHRHLRLYNQFHTLHQSPKVVSGQLSLLHHSILGQSAFQRVGVSSSASAQSDEKVTTRSRNGQGNTAAKGGDAEVSDQSEASTSGKTHKKEESNSEDDLSVDDLVKLVAEKEELLEKKQKEVETMQDKVLRSYAEMENVMGRTKREAENSKKFAIQNFAKSLLDVADNLGRASSVVKDSFAKIDTSEDTAGAVPLLQTLLEGVEMTEKQMMEVFKKFGVEKFDPTNEQFDPHRHNAVFQVADPSKAPDTVAVVVKSGYLLYDRIIRPAEVGVAVATDNKEASYS